MNKILKDKEAWEYNKKKQWIDKATEEYIYMCVCVCVCPGHRYS